MLTPWSCSLETSLPTFSTTGHNTERIRTVSHNVVQAEEEKMTFMDFPTPRELVLTSGTTKIGIIPDIDLVSHFQVDAWQVLYRPMQTGNVRRWGLPLMIPNFSRLKNGIFEEKGTTLPIHGFGRLLPWTLTEQS